MVFTCTFIYNLLLRLLSVMYFDQLLLAARQVNVVYSDQLLGAAYYIHFISYHDNRYDYTLPFFTNELRPKFQNKLESFFAENFSDLFMS